MNKFVWIFTSTLPTIIISSAIGLIISYVIKLPMGEDVWFWFFSTIAQTFAALVALVAIFFISRIELDNYSIQNYNNLNVKYTSLDIIVERKKNVINQMKILLPKTILIIILSIVLLPFDHLKNWFLIFVVIGLCMNSLVNISQMIGVYLSEPE